MTKETLNIIDWNNEAWYEIKASFDTELMISRLIPSHRTGPLRVRVHSENTKILRMVMSEYPLEIITDKWKNAELDIKKRIETAKKLSKLEFQMPDKAHFIGELMPFQKEGLDFLMKTDGKALLTDEMGLGKTPQSLSFISKNPKDLPVIVIAPLVVLINWKREIEKFLRVDFVDYGKQKRLNQDYVGHIPIINIVRDGKEKALPVADITLINYELVRPRLKDLCNLEPKTLILDEIHSLRNDTTGKYQACKVLAYQKSVKHRIGLSGTPLYNHGTEMYNICEIIQPGVLGEKDEFIRRYCNYYGDTTKDDVKESLYKLLRSSVMIRRKKADVLEDLKDKVKMRQSISIDTELYMSGMSKMYEKIEEEKAKLSKMVLEDDKKEGLFSLNKRIREMTTAERQIAGLAKAPYVVQYLLGLLEDYEDEKFVVFCHHLAVHKLIFDGLFRYNPVQVIGGQSDRERQYAIDTFQKGKDSRVIICGLRAGSLGINLTSASYVIFAELDWSPSVHLQAEDRLHRIGQKNVVFAHYLEGEGTFDEIISQKLLNKAVVINDVLGDKMETLDNKKALDYLEKRFQLSKMEKESVILDDLQQTF